MSLVERAESFLNKRIPSISVTIVVVGLIIRFYYDAKFYLNPDEALHYTASVHPWHGVMGFYRDATLVFHPPLFVPILQAVTIFGHSEVLLRMVPSICGALFPWFASLWVRTFANTAAGLCTQLLLTFSPEMIRLSAEVRAYMLAFLFLSIALLFLEKSLNSGNQLSMIWFNVFLYLSIVSEYCVVWFVTAVSVYALLRLWKEKATGRLCLLWSVGQFLALGLYLVLYKTQIVRLPHSVLETMPGWLQNCFPAPHESLIRFAADGTFEQFRYMFFFQVLDWASLVLFLFGLYWLGRHKSPFYAILMVLPFCAACIGAILHVFPYGSTRHTSILEIAIAATMAVAIARFTGNRILPIAAAALPLLLIWSFISAGWFETIPAGRHQLTDMRDAAAFLRNNIPSDALIVTDAGTELMLGYYLGCPDVAYFDTAEPYRSHQCGNLHFVIDPSFQFASIADLQIALAQVKSKYGSDRTLWVAAGGFGPRVNVANQASNAKSFGRAIAIFRESDLEPQPVAHLQPNAQTGSSSLRG
jgi:hypothetical protein